MGTCKLTVTKDSGAHDNKTKTTTTVCEYCTSCRDPGGIYNSFNVFLTIWTRKSTSVTAGTRYKTEKERKSLCLRALSDGLWEWAAIDILIMCKMCTVLGESGHVTHYQITEYGYNKESDRQTYTAASHQGRPSAPTCVNRCTNLDRHSNLFE
ncbi:hypothetical protein J6590_032886 [Homalodisca vitripennis]|nr:hypothetical protein J6590_032886 [Homalodisca vitripennis]